MVVIIAQMTFTYILRNVYMLVGMVSLNLYYGCAAFMHVQTLRCLQCGEHQQQAPSQKAICAVS